uniref:Uncharacterized protein n=1 Tax=Parascaris equorum TaxID=6256 RepID=A0A914RFK4_PAREQ
MTSVVARLHTINKLEIFENLNREELSIRYSQSVDYIIRDKNKIFYFRLTSFKLFATITGLEA